MKALFLLCGILMLIPLGGSMAFDAQVALYDFNNPEFTSISAICPNGNMAVMHLMSEMGVRAAYLQVFNPQNQALWDEPIRLYNTYTNNIKMLANQDNSISICYLQRNENSSYRYTIDTYDAQGNLVTELSDITVYERYGLSSGTIYFLNDQQGGFHFGICDGQYYYRYQHIDSAGNLAHPLSGLNLGYSDLDYRFVMTATADNGAVICYPHLDDSFQDRILLTKIDGDHQIAWQSDYQAADMFPNSLLLLDGIDDAFYTVARLSQNGVAASKIDYLGNVMWPQEWTPESGQDRFLAAAVVTSLGNLVVHTGYMQGYSLPDYYYCEVVDPSGITLHSSEIDHPANRLVADNYGGWFALDFDDSSANPSNLVQHYDSSYVPGPGPVYFALDLYLQHYAAFITPEGDDLRIIYDYRQGNQAEICTQLVDNQLNLIYPQSGFSLVSGVSDMTFNVMAITMPNGALFTMWRQGNNSYLHPHKIMYNVVTPRGQTLFSTAQCFMEEAQYIRWFSLFPVDDGQVLICWVQGSGDNTSSYAQLLKPGTGAL